MEHHNDVGTSAQRFGIAGLLVSAVAAVAGMYHVGQAEPDGDLDRLILRGVIDQEQFVNDLEGDLCNRPLQRRCRIVSRQYDDHALVLDQS